MSEFSIEKHIEMVAIKFMKKKRAVGLLGIYMFPIGVWNNFTTIWNWC